MSKKQVLIMAVVGVVMFSAGFFIRGLWGGSTRNQPQPAMEEILEAGQAKEGFSPEAEAGGYLTADVLKVRVNDGDVEWYDGSLWHRVASVEELEANDPFYMAQEKYGEFEEQLRQEEAVQRQQAGALLVQNQTEISVWQQESPKSTPKPASKPQPQTAVTAPAQTTGTPQQSADNGSSGDDSNDSDNNATPAEQPAETPAEPPADTGGTDTGDGENMEWSEDYL